MKEKRAIVAQKPAALCRVATGVRQIRVLQRSGLIDVRRLDQTLRTARGMRALGPIAGGVWASARRDPHRLALIDGENRLTYRQLDRYTNGVAREWMGRDVTADSTIAVLCRDGLDLVSTMVAAGKIGARLVLLNTGFSGHQLRDVAQRESATDYVYNDEFAAALNQIGEHRRLSPVPAGRLDDRGNRPIDLPSRQGQFVLLTGGTTGTPKGAPRRVASPLAAAQFLDRVPLRRGQTMLLCAPLFHGTALSQFIIGLNLGSTIVVHGRFDARTAVDQLARYRCEVVVLVPTMLRRITDLGARVIATYDTSSLNVVFTAGAALPPALGDAITELFGPCIYNFYGCTETGTATIATPEDWTDAPGTVGKPPVGITVALYDGDTQVTESGQRGTIHVGNTIAFQGYSGGGSKAMHGGLMSTGDIGHWDHAGRLFVDGRDDDMIVSGGENVFPGEVEDVLSAHPAVAEVSVSGVPDDEYGQRLAAFLVTRTPLDADTVRDYVKTRTARFKVPRDVVFLGDLPRTPTGKIDRNAITAAHHDWLIGCTAEEG